MPAAFSSDTLVYIDLNRLLTESIASVEANKKFEIVLKENIDNFEKIKNKLKEEESSLISQKNILSNNEYQKKINKLREKTKEYRDNRKNKINELRKQKVLISSNFIQLLNPIIADYAASKSISIVIQKKNIIIGKLELDITNDILEIANKKIKKIELK